MRTSVILTVAVFLFTACNKSKTDPETSPSSCDIAKVCAENETKVTITNGIWGTVALKTGNCMPMVLPAPAGSCRTCPVKRTVRIYDYTLNTQVTPHNSLQNFDSFSTQLIKQFDTDENGFFQTELPAGQYTMVVLESGKLYGFGYSPQFGYSSVFGISPVIVTSGRQKVGYTTIDKAAY